MARAGFSEEGTFEVREKKSVVVDVAEEREKDQGKAGQRESSLSWGNGPRKGPTYEAVFVLALPHGFCHSALCIEVCEIKASVKYCLCQEKQSALFKWGRK